MVIRPLDEPDLPAVLAILNSEVREGIALPNDSSVKLHEQLGMPRVATFPAVGFKQARWTDVGYWSMRLGPPNRPTTGAAIEPTADKELAPLPERSTMLWQNKNFPFTARI